MLLGGVLRVGFGKPHFGETQNGRTGYLGPDLCDPDLDRGHAGTTVLPHTAKSRGLVTGFMLLGEGVLAERAASFRGKIVPPLNGALDGTYLTYLICLRRNIFCSKAF